MKYGGTITILNDQGETVHERELTADEMIEELIILRGKEFTSVEVMATPAETKVVATLAPTDKGKKVCKICSKPGHMQKTCKANVYKNATDAFDKESERVLDKGMPVAGTHSTPSPSSHEILNMSPMGKQNFEVLKEMQMEGQDATEISREIKHEDLDDIEVALKSSSYLVYTFDRKKMLAKKMQGKQ